MDKSGEFDIELGQSVRRHIESKRSPLETPGLCALPYDQPSTDQTPVFIAESVMRAIERHVLGEKGKEVGGVLLGGFFRNEKGSFVEVTDFIEATAAKGTDVSLTFTHETWEQVHAEQARRGSDAQIIGWYHSHPALGVFMSREDEFIHSSFFADPWHIAVVVDPIYHNWGCFKWADGALDRTGGFYVFAEKKSAKRVKEYTATLDNGRQSAPRHASAAADRRGGASRSNSLLTALVAILLVSQLVMGYLLWTRKPVAPPQPNYYLTAMMLISASDLSGAAQHLRMELITHPGNEAAYTEMQRLNAILASPGVANEEFDRTNLMLTMATDLARRVQIAPQPSALDSLKGVTPGGKPGELTFPGPDLTKRAAELYEQSAGTWKARLQRAKDVVRLAGPRHSVAYDKAVEHLAAERVRGIAYGQASGDERYYRLYKELSASDKAAVKKMLLPGRRD